MVSVASVVFDILMAGIVVLAVVLGVKLGFVRMVFILGIVFFAALIARFTMPVVKVALEKLQVEASVKSAINDSILNYIEKDETLDFNGVVEKLELPKEIAAAAENAIEGVKEAKGAILADKLSAYLSGATVKLISYVACAVIVIILLLLISLLTKLIQKIPVVGTINSVFGVIVGVCAALIAVFLICMLVSSFGLGASDGLFADISHKSLIIRLLNAAGITGRMIK